MLVLVDLDRPGLASRHLNRDDFLGEIARRDGLAGTLLRSQRKGILVGARDLEFLGDVLASLRHGIDAILLFHQWIDEAPANRGVVDLSRAGERLRRLALYKRRTRHRLHA